MFRSHRRRRLNLRNQKLNNDPSDFGIATGLFEVQREGPIGYKRPAKVLLQRHKYSSRNALTCSGVPTKVSSV